MVEEKVILVNEKDQKIGLSPKMEAHKKALLHRAFSVFVLNKRGEVMLQKRALDKYHSPGLWTNTCCSHQREQESNIEAGKRRLKEEMGLEAVELQEWFSFIYKASLGNGLTEHELDYVMLGYSNQSPCINPKEVAEWKWMAITDIKEDLQKRPEQYTVWFKIIFEKFYNYFTLLYENQS